ncbi:signal transduction histidine kinase [Spirochaeta isovalerica]|uniref:histidine kinase n=1 Tax=Spirochaeta isovalerica TaxID=150 RepID=A0A841RAG0_9SPIO|nr:signal transduction histidine kinase [Spirochaeta isovalerica]
MSGLQKEAEVLSLFIAEKVVEDFNEYRFSESLVFKLLRPALIEKQNIYSTWRISFNVIQKGVPLFKNPSFDILNLPEEVKTAERGGNVWVLRRTGDSCYLRVAMPLDIFRGETVITFEKEISQLFEQRQKLIGYMLIFILAFMFIFVPLSLLLSRTITLPLENILSQMENFVSDNNFDTRKLSVFEEIRQLQKHFASLSMDISSQIDFLKRESESKELFLAKVNHEINTPITSIKGFADLLLRSPYDEQLYTKALSHISHESLRISELNGNLQKLVIPSDEYLWETFSLNSVIDDAVESLRFLFEKKGVRVEREKTARNIRGNLPLLVTAFKNFIHNAIKASFREGIIFIKAEESNGELKVCIIDGGIGFSGNRAEEANLYESFSGLGLALCDEILRLHKCHWLITPLKNGGTKVCLDFTTILQKEDKSDIPAIHH